MPLYPTGGPRPTSSEAERAFYRALQRHLPASWSAWHSLRVRVGPSFEGEGDFVIAVPDRAILLVEVKGGAIECRDGLWFQSGRPMEHAPRDQAHRFRRILDQKLEATLTGYIPIPWPWKPLEHHVLALRAAGGVSGGNYPAGNTYFVGGYNLPRHDLPDTITSGVFNGAFVLRGYAPNAFGGREYVLGNAEYRFPIVVPDRGLSTIPIYLRRIDGNLFMDAGGAFDDFNLKHAAFFRHGRFLDTDLLHASFGAELWFGVTIGYGLYTQLRLGWARGVTDQALQNGQWYFVASSAY